MSYNSIDPMSSAGNMLDLIAKKQKLIGENLANIDTPGYSRKDMQFGEYLNGGISSLENRLTDRFGGTPVSQVQTGEPVNPANELMELQKNSLLYTMATRQMSSVITQMRTAINVGK